MALSYFTTKSWAFTHDKLLWLRTHVPPWDSMHFNLHGIENMDQTEFIKNAILGARMYLLKEGTDTLPHARRHYIR
jgi:hypothetical protein